MQISHNLNQFSSKLVLTQEHQKCLWMNSTLDGHFLREKLISQPSQFFINYLKDFAVTKLKFFEFQFILVKKLEFFFATVNMFESNLELPL